MRINRDMDLHERQIVRLLQQALDKGLVHPRLQYTTSYGLAQAVSKLANFKIQRLEVSTLLDRMGVFGDGPDHRRSKRKLRRRLQDWLPAAIKQDTEALRSRPRLVHE